MAANVVALLVVALVVLVIVISRRPAEFRISRTRRMDAPPDVVHAWVNDFQKWPSWSPWEKLDPNMKREIAGGPGTGATYFWSGNSKAGEGRMTITDSQPAKGVTLRLEFVKPWKSTSTTHFSFEPDGPGTHVVWAMTGEHNFVTKAMCLFMDMDKMVGPDFERGLVSLDEVTAAKPKGA
jgi:hypothetical protein